MFANGTARVVIRSLAAKGVTPGSFYKFPAPAQLCLAGHGSSTWKTYAWDANGVNNLKYSQYGDEGNFGEFTITGCYLSRLLPPLSKRCYPTPRAADPSRLLT